MRRSGLSMRWWLGVAFAAIAALTAVSVAEVFKHRADVALRERGQALAVGQSVGAAQSVTRALHTGNLAAATPLIAQRHRLSVFVFSARGRLISDPVSRGVAFRSVPGGRVALGTALNGDRYVGSVGGGKAFVVGLRQTSPAGGAVVTYTPRPDLRQELGIVQSEVVRSSAIALALGALVGLLVASLIAARLGRIARAAAAIEAGDFDRPLHVRFRDEVGSLATTIDQMRLHLRQSFKRLEAERDHLHRLLDSLDQCVLAVGRDLTITYANEPARELFGQEELELPRLLVGASPSSRFRPSQRIFSKGGSAASFRRESRTRGEFTRWPGFPQPRPITKRSWWFGMYPSERDASGRNVSSSQTRRTSSGLPSPRSLHRSRLFRRARSRRWASEIDSSV